MPVDRELMSGIFGQVAELFLEPPKRRSRRFRSPFAMYQLAEPHFQLTPMHKVIDDELIAVADGETRKLMLFAPPQEGKSQAVSRRFPAWLLAQDPTLRIVIASYNATLARRWGKRILTDIREHPEWGIILAPGTQRAEDWQTSAGGGVVSVGIGGGLTGRPVDIIIIDDPVKDAADAISQTMRDRAYDWYEGSVTTRLGDGLAGGAAQVLMMCLTGDTAVLLADGTEKLIRDVRPGDAVATYEHGSLTSSLVRNWAAQGPDTVYEIRMKSGASVRANARHPFLTVQDGVETWERTASISPGSSILRATGDSTAARSAATMAATPRSSARACACRTTTRLAGLPEFDLRPSTRRLNALLDSNTATASPSPSTTSSWLRRAASATSAAVTRLLPGCRPLGSTSSASTTTTTPEPCAHCSATTATSSSVAATPRQTSSDALLSTWSITPDEVLAVVEIGVEDVYDVQIDRTENFIANGLVSHNTRWHEDDLSGRLLANETDWKVVRIPAICDSDDDPLGRAIGEELKSARNRGRARYFDWVRRTRSSWMWNALYQQRPTPGDGGKFRMSDLRFWSWAEPDEWGRKRISLLGVRTVPLHECWLFTTVDLAATVKQSGDWLVASTWAVTLEGFLLLIDRVRVRAEVTDHVGVVLPLHQRWKGNFVGIEDLKDAVTLAAGLGAAGVPVKRLDPNGAKEIKALWAIQMVEQHMVWLPSDTQSSWVTDFVDEMVGFPNAKHDDQVDTLSHAARFLHQGSAGASLSVVTIAEGPSRQGELDLLGDGDGVDWDAAQW